MEKFDCLLCGKEMEIRHRISHIDYHCTTEKDHHFAWRIANELSTPGFSEVQDRKILQLRVKLMTGEENLYLKLFYTEGYSQVWSKDRSTERIKINSIIYPDFVDLEKLKNKLRTILVFS